MLIFWVFLYGLSYLLAESVSSAAGNCLWLTPLVMLGYIVILFTWLTYTNQAGKLGLSSIQLHTQTDFIYFIPLLAIPVQNLLSGSALISSHSILLMFSVCCAEEVMFRGFLLPFLCRHLGLWGILCAALAFSCLHSVNLFSGLLPSYVLIQMCLAFFIAIYYSLIRLYYKSLYPCIAAHFLTNITASSNSLYFEYCLLHIIILICCEIVLYSKISSKLEDIS